jgi:Mg2+ and Co2+ transporter CorA
VLWAILDSIVDDYAPVIEGLEGDIEEVEATVFSGAVAPPSASTSRAERRRTATESRTPCSDRSRRWNAAPTSR